jgi:hypothetical protein
VRPPALCRSTGGSGGAALLSARAPAVRRRAGLAPARAASTEPAAAAPSSASTKTPPLPDSELAALVAKLKASVRQPGRGPLSGAAVVDAFVALEKQRLPADGWREVAARPGARWRLVYTAPEKVATAASKRQPHGPATVFPLTACQKFDDSDTAPLFTNGVFVGGGLASLTFAGPFEVRGRLLQFDVCTMAGNVGPWKFSFPIKKGAPATLGAYSPEDRKKLPFFSYIYADDEMIVARGRSGGLAAWSRADAGFLAETGVLRMYD